VTVLEDIGLIRLGPALYDRFITNRSEAMWMGNTPATMDRPMTVAQLLRYVEELEGELESLRASSSGSVQDSQEGPAERVAASEDR
jgi:hypothetical protein